MFVHWAPQTKGELVGITMYPQLPEQIVLRKYGLKLMQFQGNIAIKIM